MRILYLLFILCLGPILPCLAQSDERKPFEAGVQFTTLRLNTLGEGAAGIGGRASYEFKRGKLIFAPELEYNYFPQNPSGNFGESQLLTGVRVGFRIDRVGIFVKARPGFVHFGGDDFRSRNNGPSTNFACDFGAIFEYPATGRVGARFDFGDTLVNYPRPVFTGGSVTLTPSGLYDNFQGGVGIVFRF